MSRAIWHASGTEQVSPAGEPGLTCKDSGSRDRTRTYNMAPAIGLEPMAAR